MNDIRLDESTINIDGEWLSIEDLSNLIQEKIQSGDLKLTKYAAALEKLKTALENSHILEAKLIITKDEYEKLKSLGGDTDSECIRRAILSYINTGLQPSKPEAETQSQQQQKGVTIQCPHPQCMTPIEVETGDRPVVVECPNCGLSGRLSIDNKWDKL